MKVFKNYLIILMTFNFVSNLYSQSKFNYPITKTVNRVDEYHGIKIEDPYQWLECDTCAEVRSWVKQQQEFTEAYFQESNNREKIRNRLTEIWSFNSMSIPVKKKNKLFYFKNSGKENHSRYFILEKGLETELINPNSMSEDGTTALTSTAISPDGNFVAYSISKKGSDWNEIFVYDIKSKKLLKDHLLWIKFSGISWKENGFFYSRYDEPKGGQIYSSKNEFHKVYYHQIGTSQDKDQLIVEDKQHPLRNFYVYVVDEKFLALSSSEGTSGNSLGIANIENWKKGQPINFIKKVDDFKNDYTIVGSTESGIYVITNANAPKQQLIRYDLDLNARTGEKVIIPEGKSVMESVTIVGKKLLVKYLENVSSRLAVYTLNGEFIKDIELPVIGSVTSLSGEKDNDEFYYSMVSYTFPSRIYKSNVSNFKSELYFKPDIDFDSDNFTTKQVFYKSKDGTTIPMFITHKKNIKLTGKNPCFLFGYGGFNISYTPEFRVDRSVFLEQGGIYCVANIRGGGEFGEEWHKAGTQLKKQNVFDDFIAAANYLIAENYTNSDHLAIHGRSNGGLLAGACLTQRPDLYKCVIPQVGVLDMLKFHKFTIGWAWIGDYGSSDNEEQFNYLLKYSPVHNVKKIKYPATLIVTGDHDDRVVPAHSFKFIAELQSKQQGDQPVLIRIDSGGGHGSGKPLQMQITEYSDMWTFVMDNLGMKMYE